MPATPISWRSHLGPSYSPLWQADTDSCIDISSRQLQTTHPRVRCSGLEIGMRRLTTVCEARREKKASAVWLEDPRWTKATGIVDGFVVDGFQEGAESDGTPCCVGLRKAPSGGCQLDERGGALIPKARRRSIQPIKQVKSGELTEGIRQPARFCCESALLFNDLAGCMYSTHSASCRVHPFKSYGIQQPQAAFLHQSTLVPQIVQGDEHELPVCGHLLGGSTCTTSPQREYHVTKSGPARARLYDSQPLSTSIESEGSGWEITVSSEPLSWERSEVIDLALNLDRLLSARATILRNLRLWPWCLNGPARRNGRSQICRSAPPATLDTHRSVIHGANREGLHSQAANYSRAKDTLFRLDPILSLVSGTTRQTRQQRHSGITFGLLVGWMQDSSGSIQICIHSGTDDLWLLLVQQPRPRSSWETVNAQLEHR
ncbi:hypothetical protein BKA70DRAFT_1227278 [Coprinopsis sp. MPI-PUGE-AT-0042]|nr:hypothetical protein BKA70DRAFT_1227278 [Coprinopsis sp. MPI-PUGE-AT-0042]